MLQCRIRRQFIVRIKAIGHRYISRATRIAQRLPEKMILWNVHVILVYKAMRVG